MIFAKKQITLNPRVVFYLSLARLRVSWNCWRNSCPSHRFGFSLSRGPPYGWLGVGLHVDGTHRPVAHFLLSIYVIAPFTPKTLFDCFVWHFYEIYWGTLKKSTIVVTLLSWNFSQGRAILRFIWQTAEWSRSREAPQLGPFKNKGFFLFPVNEGRSQVLWQREGKKEEGKANK